MRVYKFLSKEFALDDLKRRRIKISEFSDMNDPFELEGAVVSDPVVHHILQQHWRKTIGALCFSRQWHNAVLWSHYADKHKGICLVFEITGELEVPRYVKEPQVFSADVLLAAAPKYSMPTDPEFREAESTIYELLLTKSEEWRYEDEVRLMVRLNKDQLDGGLYFAEFDEKIRPSAVILGVRCSIATSEIDDLISSYSPPLTVVRAKLSPTSFKVVADTEPLQP